ncbi:MAG: amidophosphoribosyltransferase, partial [Deltaproteobacteria bacterium]
MYDDRLHDSCGVFGIHAPGLDVARLTFFGLYALQHRGQESAGIAVADDGQVTVIKDLGLVSQVFNEQMLQSLSGQHAIGHVRYSTTGASHWQNSQPLVRSRNGDVIALGHNGNLVNTTELRDELLAQGVKFSGTTDTEVITALIAHEAEGDLLGAVRTAVSKIRGAFSAAVMSGDAVVGFRDPYGVRPLCLGDYEGHPVFSSETSGLDIIGADFVREIQPGEIVIADSEHGLRSERVELEGARPALCIFEFIYFARPDSVMNGKTLHVVRQNMGRHLSMEAPVEADLVVPVPDTGMPAAIGYAAASGIPYTEGLIKNRYVHRTFIQPDDNLRQVGIRMKLNPLTSVIKGKRLVVVDDSIVRGNTTRRLVQMLFDAGAAEVHLRISSPPIQWPC